MPFAMSSNDGKTSTEADGNVSVQDSGWMSKASRLWARTGITWRLYQSMFKGALAPTIAVSLFQATAFAQQYVCYLNVVSRRLSADNDNH
jgi:phospholipase C